MKDELMVIFRGLAPHFGVPAELFVAVEYVAARFGSAKKEAMRNALRSLARRASRLERRTESSGIAREQLAELVLRLVRLHEDTLFEEKLDLAAEVVLRSAVAEEGEGYIAFSYSELLLNAVQSLPSECFSVLAKAGAMVGPRGAAQALRGRNVPLGFVNLKEALGSIDEDVLMALLGELGRFNLIRTGQKPTVGSGGGKYDDIRLDVTPLGLQLLQFLSQRSGDT